MDSGSKKKLILVAALLVVAVGVYWFWGRAPQPLTGSLKFVCVATGKQYTFRRSAAPAALPGTNPDTNENTLLPCSERDGKLYISGSYSRLLHDRLAEVNRYVDPDTLEVLEAPRQ